MDSKKDILESNFLDRRVESWHQECGEKLSAPKGRAYVGSELAGLVWWASEGIRTPDRLITRELLCQLSYTRHQAPSSAWGKGRPGKPAAKSEVLTPR
jgi:hypothetical protein